MTDLTLMHLADTALKVGLGAVISGVIMYQVSKRNHSHELQKAKWESRRDFISRIIDSTQEYFSGSSMFLAGIAGVADELALGIQQSQKHDDFLNKVEKEFEPKRYIVELSYGYLLVAFEGDSESSKLLWKYNDKINQLRKAVYGTPNAVAVPSLAAIQNYRQDLSNIRKEFFISLNECIKSDFA